MNPAENTNRISEILDDVQLSLRNLEKAGIRLVEKPVFKPDNQISQTIQPVKMADNKNWEKTIDGYCSGCSLCSLSLQKTAGKGTGSSGVMFVSMLPFNEGNEAYELLKRIITAMNIGPENAYITGIIKCITPDGFMPDSQDISCCMNYLYREISGTGPDSIVALGEPASRVLLGYSHPFESIEGIFHDWNGLKIMPTYHPDDLLADPSKKRNVWEAMKKVMAILATRVKA